MHERELARAINALTAFLQGSVGAFSRQDAKEMEERIIKAFGERVDPKSVSKLAAASDKLEKAVEANQSTP